MPVRFDEPVWLVLLILIIPAYLMARRSIGGLSRTKATIVFALRVIVIASLAIALAQPIWEKRGKGLTVTTILDRSLSVPLPLKRESIDFLQRAAEIKESNDDRVAVVTLARDANIAAMPDPASVVTPGQDEADMTATNLAAGVRLAMAIAPDDTANRIVLASDGNETIDSVLAAADLARANSIPIDVLLLEYEHENEVIFERIVAPARERRGKSARLKMVLGTQRPATGTISLRMNGVPIDLNGPEPGETTHVELEPGPAAVHELTISLDEAGPQRFEAAFTPDDPAQDVIDQNNSAVAVTFVGGEGKVLVIDDGSAESQYLVRALKEAQIDVVVSGPEAVSDLIALSGYDAIVLANIPRAAFDDDQDLMLHAYVHDLGGGLVMVGGDKSFGAGAWFDSEVSRVLPVELNPPHTRQILRGALALVMHSCEMAQGNYWGQKVAIAAIEALSRLDYVGIIEFNWNKPGAGGMGSSWAFPMQPAGDKSAAIAAAKQMVMGDMPDFDSSMQLALDGLNGIRAGQKHTIIISDGDPSPPSQALLNKFISNSITVTTVMVGGHGTPVDRGRMSNVASVTGGRFYEPKNPKQLPQIFIKEAQLVSRSLIQEGDLYQPQVVSRLPGPVEAFASVPAIEGYVLTSMREGLVQTPIVFPTQDGNDPIYAHWNYGLGKSIAYTSDLTGRWGSRWVSWSDFQKFWEQSTRWVMRPSSPANIDVKTHQEGDRAVIEVEALNVDASFMNFLKTNAVVIGPDAVAAPLMLQQTGPGKYRGEFVAGGAGAYLVNINYAGGSDDAPLRGNVQAAVTVPYAREFRDVKHNAALLRRLAEMTGGRMLSPTSPELADLFNRESLEVPTSPKRIWDLLAILAAALFVFDVAARRLSIDPRWVRGLAARAMGRRADVGEDTMAAWKRARAQVAHRRGDVRIRPEEAAATERYEASEQDAATAFDVGGQSPAETRPRPAPVTRRPPAAGAPGADEGDYTSRLLKAKRRARGESEEPKDPGHA
jgi:uncharacterized membrane protein